MHCSCPMNSARGVGSKKKILNNNKKVIVEARVTVHWPKCTVHVPWTMQEALVQKKKKNVNAREKTQTQENPNEALV